MNCVMNCVMDCVMESVDVVRFRGDPTYVAGLVRAAARRGDAEGLQRLARAIRADPCMCALFKRCMGKNALGDAASSGSKAAVEAVVHFYDLTEENVTEYLSGEQDAAARALVEDSSPYHRAFFTRLDWWVIGVSFLIFIVFALINLLYKL